MSQKYVVVHFFETSKVPVQFHYSQWPLHVTLLANFTLSEPLDILIDKLGDYASMAKPFDIVSDGNELFGPEQNISVTLIKRTDEIVNMHRDLTNIASSLGAVYDQPQYMDEGYRPHVTKQIENKLVEKKVYTVDNFTLVDMFPDSDIKQRRVIQTYNFNG